MTKKSYRILWADDDINVILPPDRVLNKYSIQIVGTATNGLELEELINQHQGLFDAVIVDANFNRRSQMINPEKGERDLSGLTHALSLEKSLKTKGIDCPFILYTQRDETVLHDTFSDGELDIIEKNGRLIFKSQGIDVLLPRVVEVIEETNSPEFQLRSRYAEEFQAACIVEDAERLLMEGLMFEYTDSIQNVQDYFNPVRKIAENIISKCQKFGYLPTISLNGTAKLLKHPGIETEGYSLKQGIMDKTLAHSFGYFLDITQDASHDKDDLSLGVTEYVRNRKNSHLFQSALHIAMDLLLWFKDLILTDPIVGNVEMHYIYKGTVIKQEIEKKTYYCIDKYQLQWCEEIKEGKEVIITGSIANNTPWGNVTEYVHRKNYKIL